MLITDGSVLAGVGQHLGPIHRHGDLAHLQELQRLGQFQHPHEGLLQQRSILPAEGADRVVVRMGIPANHPHRHTVPGGLLDAPGTKYPGGVTIEQQRQEHPRRILFTAGAPLVDPDLAQIQPFYRIQNKMRQVTRGHPLAQIRRQKQGGIVINRDESCGHTLFDNRPRNLFNQTEKKPPSKSDRLLGEHPPG